MGRGETKRGEAVSRQRASDHLIKYRPLIIRPFTTKAGQAWCLRALAQQDGVEAKRPAGRSI